MFLYRVYKLVSWLFLLLAPAYLFLRLLRGKETIRSIAEKLSLRYLKRPKGKLIWFHAASVGELKSILPLVRELEKKSNVIVTTITMTSYQIFKQAKLTRSIHQFLPLDAEILVSKFLNHWQPELGVFVDSELWPNLITCASECGVKLINLNARISDKSYTRWLKCSSFASYIYDKFSSIIACSNNDTLKISQFTDSKKIQYYGNLKFANCSPSHDLHEYKKFVSAFKNKKLWLASSTHKGEEEIILSVHKKLLKKHDNLLLIIVPRHPKRGQAVVDIAQKLDLTSVLRSSNKDISSALQVYVADTVGELGIWYRLSDIVFVGGSLIAGGGHNILEPAALKSAIIVGQHTANFKDIISSFKSSNALIEVSGEKELYTAVEKLLTSASLRNKMLKAALHEAKHSVGVLEKVLAVINKI